LYYDAWGYDYSFDCDYYGCFAYDLEWDYSPDYDGGWFDSWDYWVELYMYYSEYYGGYYDDYDGGFGEMAWAMSVAVADDIQSNMDVLMSADDLEWAMETIIHGSIWDHVSFEYGHYAAENYADYMVIMADGITDCLMEYEANYGIDIYSPYFDEQLTHGVYWCALDVYYEYSDYSDYYDDLFWEVAVAAADDVIANLDWLMYSEDIDYDLENVLGTSIYDSISAEYGSDFADYYSDYIADYADDITDCMLELESRYGLDVESENFHEDLTYGIYWCALGGWYDESEDQGCGCWANGGENEPMCEGHGLSIDACLSMDGRCHWGPGEVDQCAAEADAWYNY